MADEPKVPTLAELRTEASTKAKELREMRSAPVDKRDEAWRNTATELVRTVNMLDAEITITEAAERSAPVNEPRGPRAATQNVTGRDSRSLGEIVADQFKEGRKDNQPFEARISATSRERRTLLDYANTGSTSAKEFVPVGSPFLSTGAIDRRRLFVEDLLGSADTNLASVPYIRELTPRTTEEGALTVAEGASKPEVTSLFVRADAPVRKVAAWFPVTDEIMDDAPTLAGYIDARLQYMVSLRAEAEILNGDGTGTHLLGLTQCTGVQSQSVVHLPGGSVADPASSLAFGMEKVNLVDGDADASVLHPSDYWGMVTLRPTGDGHYDGGSPYGQSAPNTPWGLPNVRSRSLTAGTALVGSFRLGAQVFNRTQLSVTVGAINDQFIKNERIILAERRLALAIHRPDFFVNVAVA